MKATKPIVNRVDSICPEESVNIFSYLSFSWLDPLFRDGYKRPLENEDLWTLPQRLQSELLCNEFEKYWNLEMNAARTITPKNPVAREPSIYKAIHSFMFWKLAPVGFIKMFCDACTIVAPLLLKAIITFVASADSPPLSTGMAYVFVLFALNMGTTISLNYYFQKTTTLGMGLRTAISAAIYRKSLKLSSAARQDFNAGKVMNFISTDCARIERFIMFCHVLWLGPLQIAFILGFLVAQLGVSAFAGVGLMIALAPVQTAMYKKLGAVRKIVAPIADSRIKCTQEALQGIKVLKYFSWEPVFLSRIEDLRAKEIVQMLRKSTLNAFVSALVFAVPVLACSFSFVIYSTYNELDPANVFSALTWFGELRFPLMFLPTVIVGLADFKVAMKRITAMLLAPELDEDPEIVKDAQYGVEVKNGEFIWETAAASEEEKLSDSEENKKISSLTKINLQIKKGDLVAVVGAVGSGKSSLLNALIGEMKCLSGTVKFNGSSGYAPQQAWIQNVTFEKNITFGLPYDRDHYIRALHLCALEKDIELLQDGDQTEIGERGINVSGGQRSRLNLARCYYANSEIVLMDDPLSAVDAHVGKHLFERCIYGGMRGKTRILVTHQLHFLPKVDYVIVMKDGAIAEQGAYQDLLDNNGEFATMMRSYGGVAENGDGDITNEILDDEQENIAACTRISQAIDDRKLQKKKALMSVEDRTTGNVSKAVWWIYADAAGGHKFIGGLLGTLFLIQACRLGTDLWLVQWMAKSVAGFGLNDYIGIYLTLGIAQAISSYILGIFFAYTSTSAAKVLHEGAGKRLLRAPMSFFDTTPMGRIISRFSKDLDEIDNALPDAFRMFVSTFADAISTFVLIIYATPLFAIPLLPLGILYYYVQDVYRFSSRELKRLDSISRSPLYAHFGETLTGLPTIRAYRVQSRFVKQCELYFDKTNSPYFLIFCSTRWLSIRLETLGNLLIFFAALFGILGSNTVSPALLGLSLSYALQVTGVLNWCIRQFAETEQAMNSVERIAYYAHEVENEAPAVIESNRPPQHWPSKGAIEITGLKMRYASDLPLIIKNLTINVKPQEKIGIVGRTGSGKSSLMNALFRIVEPEGGSMKIDGVEITGLGLSDLRSSLAIIPQEPVLFFGSVRYNLDPFGIYSDVELWDALTRSNLKKKISELEGGLDGSIAEGGENLSVGQRQLLCLSRAMLKNPIILIMDEATANVDYETDTIIQKCLREDFKHATILTIAHRLNTIIDYDRVLVLEQGEIAEFDKPSVLLNLVGGKFRSMVDETGEVNAQMLVEMANVEA